ncbi:hypothetical protein [Bradyrhizobium sp. JYMT SZCCT0180]|uniref:hypothetical protein n=1 Tax=Bradyrhizobium sp. JYMT SZCCT0180 TaxID=2807666 RepID=UPI001BA70C53|nr:hypothetical protein [Bradyrhizobium sp. JYMT SZCCT0180]MBR1210005.1 hypothetical protein [Bradyrhizobium sp. JYMT SZCCT0180]
MTTQIERFAARNELAENELDIVSGGVRHEITREEWERRAATNTFDKPDAKKR